MEVANLQIEFCESNLASMDKRYQVFVSSTFEDLREERSAVTGALLELDCFPAGMELFPAADEDSWTLIKQVIDDSDYYLVILAGRYGSLHESGKSYTHMEYEYALNAGKPTIALVHSKPNSIPADKTETSDDGKKRFNDFRQILKTKHCREWADRTELVKAVFTGILQLKKTRPGVGWVKSPEASDASLIEEALRLRREVDSLKKNVEMAERQLAPSGTEELAQGDDLTHVTVDFSPTDALSDEAVVTVDASLRWSDVFRSVLPQTFGGGCTVDAVANVLAGLVRQKAVQDGTVPRGVRLEACMPTVGREPIGKVLNQMVALGLVVARPHPSNVGESLWWATSYGTQAGARLVAAKRTKHQ